MSFYSLPSLIMKHPKHKDLGTAYLFYYATDAALSPSGSQGGEAKAKERLSKRLNMLVNDCLVVAKDVSNSASEAASRKVLTNQNIARQAGFDVFNALTMMDNNLFLNEQMVSPVRFVCLVDDVAMPTFFRLSIRACSSVLEMVTS